MRQQAGVLPGPGWGALVLLLLVLLLLVLQSNARQQAVRLQVVHGHQRLRVLPSQGLAWGRGQH